MPTTFFVGEDLVEHSILQVLGQALAWPSKSSRAVYVVNLKEPQMSEFVLIAGCQGARICFRPGARALQLAPQLVFLAPIKKLDKIAPAPRLADRMDFRVSEVV